MYRASEILLRCHEAKRGNFDFLNGAMYLIIDVLSITFFCTVLLFTLVFAVTLFGAP